MLMDKINLVGIFFFAVGRRARSRGTSLAFWCFFALLSLGCVLSGQAQTAVISDAFWTYQQDCNGDGYKAGTLPGDLARLNWDPSVTNCNGTLTVLEIIYSKPCASGTWSAIYTNGPHTVTSCLSLNAQHVDVAMGATGTCRDYKIEIYRSGHGSPDYVRSSTNDVDLSQHKEQ